MAVISCPRCGSDLNTDGTAHVCETCGAAWRVEYRCQECGSEPVELAACGSVGYFCEACKRPRSRTAMEKIVTEADPESPD